MKKVLFFILIAVMFSSMLLGREDISRDRGRPLQKAMVTSDFWMDVNRMNGVFRNTGIWMFDVIANDWGLEWPKGSGLSPVFAGGQYICAKVGDEVRVAGVQHSATEYQAGVIKPDGTASNPRDGAYKWYAVSPGGAGDWANWPVDQGAPLDKDGNPLLIGDKTAFSVWNDLGEHSEYGSNKLGAEIRQTIFAFNRADAMGDMIFIKWQIVNKSSSDWDSTYMAIWVDPDLGEATDDFVGCDPELGLGYCYNSDDDDQDYGAAPPAMGVDFFQGPIIDEAGSTVTLPDGTVISDKTMLKMTAYVYYNNDRSAQGNPFTAQDVWNYMLGIWKDNTPITQGGNGTNPNNPKTKFMYDGDPEAATGWLDSNADDRRFIMTTGPFSMPKWEDTDGDGQAEFGEPGVQDIVACVMVARGTSNLNSVTKLKEIDELAQLAYDLNFNLAKAPLPPVVNVSEMPNEIVLTWDRTSEFNEDGNPYESEDPIVADAVGDTVIINNVVTVIDDATYNFYGYSVYQYSDASGKAPVIIGSWDNGGTAEAEPYTSPRLINITTNKHKDVGPVGEPLVNGKEYYFGVVGQGYLEFGSPTVFSSPPTIVNVIPGYDAGIRYHSVFNDTLTNVKHHVDVTGAAIADAEVIVNVIDPENVTGHDYEVFFNQQHYYMDSEGVWRFTNYPDSVGKLGKPYDLTGTTISGISYIASPTTRDLKFILDLQAPDYDYSDGLKLTFPPDITINSAETVVGSVYGSSIAPKIDLAANTVEWGSADTTGDGEFAGGEVFVVNVNIPTLPLDVKYIVYDDGWATGYGEPYASLGNGVVHGEGTCTITEETYYFKTIKHWNLKDLTTGEIVLEDQDEIFNAAESGTGVVVDGIQIIVKGSYDAPYDFTPVADPPIEPDGGNGTYEIDSYGYNNWSEYGPTYSSRAIHSFGAGTEDLNILVQDYELRFTGEYVDTNANVVYIKEGTGSIATLYSARLYDIGFHPMNPNPGSSDAFTVRIPFEVWNVATNKQVNFMLYDRMQDSTTSKWYAFNPVDRMYCYILNTDYTETVQDPDGAEMNNLTWSLVFWETKWVKGDVIYINYANPIQLGIDRFTFSTSGLQLTISDNTSKVDLDKINVVPNPYYGYHSGEINPFNRWVQFTYLPEKCTIRIFDLAGSLVRKLEKDDATSFLKWNLENEFELPVASGIYVYHVEVPNIGNKIGKIAIFAPNERLDTY